MGNRMMDNIVSSPITSVSGVLGVLGGVAKIVAAFHPVSLPLTVLANLNELGNAFITIGLGGVGLFGRDNNVTSKQLGLDK